MKKRRSKKKKPVSKRETSQEGALRHRPFGRLSVEIPKTDASPSDGNPPAAAEPPPVAEDDSSLLAQAMTGVLPLSGDRQLAEKPARAKPQLKDLDDEVLVMRKLDELVQGEIPFDFADTAEFIEAHVAGMDRRAIRHLRRGEYSIQAHLDLHGLNREQARTAVAQFIRDAHGAGKRCVLIVHGRGFGSKDNIPVLKNKLAAWLTRGSIGRRVLAYVSAKPYDGGTGAVYVLLRGRS